MVAFGTGKGVGVSVGGSSCLDSELVLPQVGFPSLC